MLLQPKPHTLKGQGLQVAGSYRDRGFRGLEVWGYRVQGYMV